MLRSGLRNKFSNNLFSSGWKFFGRRGWEIKKGGRWNNVPASVVLVRHSSHLAAHELAVHSDVLRRRDVYHTDHRPCLMVVLRLNRTTPFVTDVIESALSAAAYRDFAFTLRTNGQHFCGSFSAFLGN